MGTNPSAFLDTWCTYLSAGGSTGESEDMATLGNNLVNFDVTLDRF